MDYVKRRDKRPEAFDMRILGRMEKLSCRLNKSQIKKY